MSGVVLQLGPVTFSGFEVPDGINFGGQQIIAVHQLTDGQKVIDSIGPAESELSFSGAFSGPTATLRARLLNSLRAAGAKLSLSWDDFCYTVVVSHFDAKYDNIAWIPYHLRCTVLQDDAAPVLAPAPSLGATVLSDLTVATDQCAAMGVDFTGAQATLTDPEATTLGSAAYNTAQIAISVVQLAITGQIATAESALTAVLLPDDSSFGPLANELVLATVAAQQLASLTYSNAFVARAARNLQNASS